MDGTEGRGLLRHLNTMERGSARLLSDRSDPCDPATRPTKMGSRLLLTCLRCFSSSADSHQVEVVSYAPPSDSTSTPTPRPTITSLEQLLPLDQFPAPLTCSEYNSEEIGRCLDQAKNVVLDIIRAEHLPELASSEQAKVYGKVTTAGFCVKTVWTVPQSIGEFLRFIRNFVMRQTWDSNIAESAHVCDLPGSIVVNYQRFKQVLTVSSRDLLVACRYSQLATTALEVSVSIESPAYPVLPDTIRIHMRAGGYYLEKTAEGTKVIAVSEMDFGGMLPAAVVMRMTALAMGKFVKELRGGLSLLSQG